MKAILCLALLLCLSVPQSSSFLFKYPLHASCKIDWTWPGVDCETIKGKLLSQIELWKGDENCKGGQKCLYELVSTDAKTIKATHTTPVKRYIDDMTFTFNAGESKCDVQGFSESRLWYAVLDYGTNYCNLRNLVEGAELHMTAGFQERTRDKVCTQYSSANCTIY